MGIQLYHNRVRWFHEALEIGWQDTPGIPSRKGMPSPAPASTYILPASFREIYLPPPMTI